MLFIMQYSLYFRIKTTLKVICCFILKPFKLLSFFVTNKSSVYIVSLSIYKSSYDLKLFTNGQTFSVYTSHTRDLIDIWYIPKMLTGILLILITITFTYSKFYFRQGKQ